MPNRKDPEHGRSPDWSAAEHGAEVQASEVQASEVPASEVPASEVPASEVPASDDLDLTPIIVTIVTSTVEIVCPAWGLKPSEVSQLSDAYAAVANKYAPDLVGRFGLELNAAFLTLAILGPHFGEARHHQEPTIADDSPPH